MCMIHLMEHKTDFLNDSAFRKIILSAPFPVAVGMIKAKHDNECPCGQDRDWAQLLEAARRKSQQEGFR